MTQPANVSNVVETTQISQPSITSVAGQRSIIYNFDINSVPDDGVIIAVGRRRMGKTTLITDLLFHKKHFQWGIVMTGTEANTNHYKQYMPELFIYDGFRPDILERIIDYQQEQKRRNKQKNMFILLEDCMWEAKKLIHNPTIRRIFMNGRHYGIFFILTLQYVMDLPPGLRSQVDYVFCCRENAKENRYRVFKNFNTVFDSFTSFDQVFQECTANFEVFVLAQCSQSSKIEDNVWYYKATEGLQFKIGENSSWWKYANQNFDPMFFEKPEKESEIPIKASAMQKIQKQHDFVEVSPTVIHLTDSDPKMSSSISAPPKRRRKSNTPNESQAQHVIIKFPMTNTKAKETQDRQRGHVPVVIPYNTPFK